jgi:hypothetical protein
VPKLSIKDYISRYLEFLVIKVKVIITKLIALISLLYSYSLDISLIVGIANCNFFIISIFNYTYFIDCILSCRLGITYSTTK